MLIGDVHGSWDNALDPAAIQFLEPDAAIFVGRYESADVPQLAVGCYRDSIWAICHRINKE